MSGTIDALPRHSVAERVLLADGTAVALRTLRADDRSVIRMLFEGLSDDSRYRRFHTAASRLSPGLLDLLCAMDGESHVAIGAFQGDELIGAARYVRPHDGGSEAEMAVTVADACQGRGLGRHLLHALARAARARGVTRFRFTLLANNGPAVRLLLGPDVPVAAGPWQRDGSIDVVDILERTPARLDRSGEPGPIPSWIAADVLRRSA